MLKTGYCTIAEANSINNSDAWNVLVDAEKQTAIDWGCVYLDRNYNCPLAIYGDLDPNDANDAEAINAFKAANAVLADKYANSELFQASPTKERMIAEKAVKAGSVSTRTKYADPVTGESYDPFPDVSALLDGYCTRASSNFGIHPLIRG